MLRWNGVDITDKVNIVGCTHRDCAGERDVLELTLDNAAQWYRWAPQEEDSIEYAQDGYSTGTLYLDAVIPQRDRYRVLAASTKRAAARLNNETFQDTTLAGIMLRCAAACRMDGRLYGLDGGLNYTYLLKYKEGYAAFLSRVLAMEGGVLKAYNGILRGIGLSYAQERTPVYGLRITDRQDGVIYRRRESEKWSAVTVVTPYAEGRAVDTAAIYGNDMIIPGLPAMNNAQAARWARGLILHHNRKCEIMTIRQRLNLKMTALARVNIDGGTDADGRWIVQKTEHDFINEMTETTLYRVTETVR